MSSSPRFVQRYSEQRCQDELTTQLSTERRTVRARVNSIINQRGFGIILFGDKTRLRRFVSLIESTSDDCSSQLNKASEDTSNYQLFELNDSVTRSNSLFNIVEPYLRDVESKRGIYGFLVVCDETNNTPDIIDNNEFRRISHLSLYQVYQLHHSDIRAQLPRTGVFEEVVGTV